jgi:hypothetical protein
MAISVIRVLHLTHDVSGKLARIFRELFGEVGDVEETSLHGKLVKLVDVCGSVVDEPRVLRDFDLCA